MLHWNLRLLGDWKGKVARYRLREKAMLHWNLRLLGDWKIIPPPGNTCLCLVTMKSPFTRRLKDTNIIGLPWVIKWLQWNLHLLGDWKGNKVFSVTYHTFVTMKSPFTRRLKVNNFWYKLIIQPPLHWNLRLLGDWKSKFTSFSIKFCPGYIEISAY